MLIVPPFMLCLNLSACAKLANHKDREKKPKKTDNVIESDTNLGLKRDLATKTNALIKGVGVGGWLQTMRNCFATLLRLHVRHMHRKLHIWQSNTKAAHLCFSVASGWTERKRERKQEQLPWGGGNRAALAPHRQITLERTHHLCLFVELSHFNPPAGPIWELTYTSPMA